MRFWLSVLALLYSSWVLADAPQVVIDTSMGKITVELDPARAPVTVKNFLSYVDAGAYDGTIFHRVIPGFMIQGGGFTRDLQELPDGETIRNEADNGLKNVEGTIAMARLPDVDSASRQFFINVNDNVHLDHTSESCTREELQAFAAASEKGLYKPLACKGFGYAVFGHVVAGMDVVHAIEIVETHSDRGYDDLPVIPVVINSISRK